MTIPIPTLGSTIEMGKVYHAYYGSNPSPGANISLSITLGSQIGATPGTTIGLSSDFGGRTGPYNYM